MPIPDVEVIDAPAGLVEKAFPGLQEIQINTDDVGFVPAIGFLALKEQPEEGRIKLLGVYTGSQPFANGELPTTLAVPHDFNQLDPQYRTAARVGKGVLGRFWNNVRATRGWIDDPAVRGVYAFDANLSATYFATRPFDRGSTLGRITHHVAVRQQDSDGVLAEAYATERNNYKDHTALFMTEPPKPWLRRLMRGAFPVPKEMGASFIAPLELDAQATLVGHTRHKR
jgi:hypothetical protein